MSALYKQVLVDLKIKIKNDSLGIMNLIEELLGKASFQNLKRMFHT